MMMREGDSVEVKYFLVAFLDLLGQREHLRKLKSLPKDLRPDEKTVRVLKATLGAVHGVRSCFSDYFNVEREDSEFMRALPADQREAVRQLTRADVVQYGFSDSFIVAVSLKDADGDAAPINGVWSALFASCSVAIVSLACHHALRGGIDAGLGVQISQSEVYGPALERAYTLEEKFAEYPRILIGAELLVYLDTVASATPGTPGQSYAVIQAQSAKRLIFTDADGRLALDFLGPEFRSLAPAATAGVVGRAYEFVRTERERMVAMGNTKLTDRYDRLVAYFRLRGPLWGLRE